VSFARLDPFNGMQELKGWKLLLEWYLVLGFVVLGIWLLALGF
jgi:hypothetical protein